MENENIGIMQLGLEAKEESAVMAEPSQPSLPSDSIYIIKDQKSASAEQKSEAASTIAGAMAICKNFGIKVDYANAEGNLLLIVHGVQAIKQASGKLGFKYIET